jgi:diadenylate cyclase
MIPWQSLLDATLFRLSALTWIDALDLLLVTISFYLLLRLIQRSRAALLLRGVLVLSGVLFIVTIILPLPAFDWVVRIALLAILVVTPIIFQPELRRLLEQIGRNTGLTWEVRQTAAEQAVPRIVRAVENLSATKTGALIALEGNVSLKDITETGVAIDGQVSSELLQSLFFSNNPLHDGAVILRADEVVAAGCVLPLTQRSLYYKRRLGTRHRAAVGLSETTDALVVVVSEENGVISVARAGNLLRPLDAASLRKHLFEFYTPSNSPLPKTSLWDLIRKTWRQARRSSASLTLRHFFSNIGMLVISFLLALATWVFVIQQTDPAQIIRLENIPLQIENVPPNTVLMSPPPSTVGALIQTTESLRPTLGSRSFQAVVSLANLEPGPHRVTVSVNTNAPQVEIMTIEPAAIDVELAAVITRTAEVHVQLTDQEALSRAYQVVGTPELAPEQVEIVGPEPLVTQVSQVQATISLANASTSLREVRPLRALDETGRDVSGITIRPSSAQINVTILRRINARDVGIRVVTQGSPAPGYWLSDVEVTPASVTLQGNPEQLGQIAGYVDTLAVDLSNTAGDINLQVPLDLPPNVQAVDSEGNTANTVTVEMQIDPRQGNLSATRRIKLIGATPSNSITVTPSAVNLILSGPLATLNEIENDPNLVQVLVGVAGLEAGQNVVTPTVIAPDDIKAQVVPPSVVVTIPSNGEVPSDELSKQ